MESDFALGLVIGAASAVFLLSILWLAFWLVRPWLRMMLSGGRGSMLHVLSMRLRGNPPLLIIDAYTSLLHRGLNVSLMEVESQYVANRAKIMGSQDLVAQVTESKSKSQ